MKATLLASLCLLSCVPARAAAPPSREPVPPGALARLGRARMNCNFTTALFATPDGKHLVANDRWFDLASGREGNPPVHIPVGHYPLVHFFSEGSYAVRGDNHYLIFSRGSNRPRV